MSAVKERFSEAPAPAPIEPLTFVNCSMEAFENPWLSHQQIMSRLARRHAVMYVTKESSLDEARGALSRGKSMRSKLRALAPNIHELRPSALLPRIYFSAALDGVFTRLRGRSIQCAAKRVAGDRRSVLYFWNPHFVDLVGKTGESLSVFHIHDYHPGFADKGTREHAAILDNFKKSLDVADVVVACSDALLEEARALGRKDAKLVENGVDYRTVSSGFDADVPPEMASLPRPILGHIGRINRKLDMEGLERMAKNRPAWSIVLMGPRTGWPEEYEARFRRLTALPNVHYIPGKGWDVLPSYINALDVGLMAYRTEGTWMSYGFPLKMWEYFSLGKSVAAADVVSIRKFAPLLELVGDDGDWLAAAERALSGDDEVRRRERQALARRYDWESRADLIERHIGDGLAAKARG